MVEMWRVSVKLLDREEVFVNVRDNVREWLEFVMRRNYVCGGMVWVKRCNSVEDLENWEFREIEYCFYRKGRDDKLVWERWGRKLV